MDTREMFNFLDSFVAGFGKRSKKDVNNAIFITSEKFEMDFPLEWRGAGRSGIESLGLYGFLDDIMPYPKDTEAFNVGRKLSVYDSHELMVMASYLWNEGKSSLTGEEMEEARALLENWDERTEEKSQKNVETEGSVIEVRIEKESNFLIWLCTKDTRKISHLLIEQGCSQYTEIKEFVGFITLDMRLQGLVYFGLVTYEKDEEEWYEITEKGRKFLEHTEEMMKLVTVPETE